MLTLPDHIRAAVSDSDFKVFFKEENGLELMIMDDIGEDFMGNGVSASSVVSLLDNDKDAQVNVRLNSPGGLYWDGLVIHNALRQHKGNVTVTVEGLAFSAASIIAMAGDTIRMHEASHLGIHRAIGVAVGNSKVARGVAEWLDKADEQAVDIYHSRTGQTREQINDWMDGTDDGTLFSAKEAIEHGFATELIPLKEPEVSSHARYAIELKQKRLRAALKR